jgi:hypothetical protein
MKTYTAKCSRKSNIYPESLLLWNGSLDIQTDAGIRKQLSSFHGLFSHPSGLPMAKLRAQAQYAVSHQGVLDSSESCQHLPVKNRKDKRSKFLPEAY